MSGIGPISDEIRFFIKDVQGCVEATSHEHMCLWERYHSQQGYPWSSNNSGYGVCVGKLADRGVHLSFLTATVKGIKILFWFPTSELVDYRLIEQWFKTYMPDIPRVDAGNFVNVFPHEVR